MSGERRLDLAAAALFGRLMLGVLFVVQGWHKVFAMGPLEHARRFFLQPVYLESWIPEWALWAVGTAVPYLELGAGALLVAGLFVRPVLLVLAAHLLVITYGHLLAEPFFDVTSHILPRAVFLLFLLVLPRSADRWCLDALGWPSPRRSLPGPTDPQRGGRVQGGAGPPSRDAGGGRAPGS